MPLNPFLYKAAAGTLHQQADINMRPQPTRLASPPYKINTAVHNKGLRYTPTLSLSLFLQQHPAFKVAGMGGSCSTLTSLDTTNHCSRALVDTLSRAT